MPLPTSLPSLDFSREGREEGLSCMGEKRTSEIRLRRQIGNTEQEAEDGQRCFPHLSCILFFSPRIFTLQVGYTQHGVLGTA